jgi:hypothetical protein
MKFALLLLVSGLAMIGYALSLPPYMDERLFLAQHMSLSAGQSTEYSKLREEMLTPKFQLEDYGITLVALAFLVFLLTRRGHLSVTPPKSRRTLVAIGLALPFLTVGGYVYDLLLAFGRGEFPYWADSMAIPLMGAPVLLVLLLLWSLAHLGFLHGDQYSPAPLIRALSLKANWWLLCLSVCTALLVFLCLVFGQYWFAFPGALWLYFYLSMGAVRRTANDNRLRPSIQHS